MRVVVQWRNEDSTYDKDLTHCQVLEVWWAVQDLNLRPSDYESPALTN
jgi:hypothetical protein